ncbi:MAG: hypothetical protein F9K22_08785 [Bacteroidetes bacterium]|nr:MAG: hypothetical protein F9K22_08785 [Bacteroidota bacterium]
MKRTSLIALLLPAALVMLAGCFPHTVPTPDEHPSGFLMGVWHGWIAPVSLVVGFFNDSVRIYDHYNTGWWYDLGFYIAIIGGFGGFALSRKSMKVRREP